MTATQRAAQDLATAIARFRIAERTAEHSIARLAAVLRLAR